MYLAGYSATRTGILTMSGGYSGTATFVVAQAASAANTGFRSINCGITTTPDNIGISLTEQNSFALRVGNNPGGSITIGSSSGRQLWGEYKYVQVPATPSTPSITGNQANSSVTVSWSGNSDWGGSSSNLGYKVELFLNGSLYTDVETASTSHTFTSMPTGYTYTARVYAYNEIRSFNGTPMSLVSGTSSGYFLPAPIVYYTVSYNYNGGSGSPSSTTVQAGQSVTLPNATRSGYTFNGWFTSSSGGSYVGTAGNSYTPSSSITLYAQWSLNTWTVSFNGNGGTTPSSITVTQGQSLTLPNSTRTGYTLNGWYTAASGGSYVGTYNTSYTPSSNITLYAQWTANAPGFTDETIVGQIYLNQDIADAGDNNVSATNATSYAIVYVSGGQDPTSWLSINSSGVLSGSTDIVGTYSFKIDATGPGGTTSSNNKTLNVVYAGERFDASLNPVQISTAKRYDGANWIDITIMRRYDGTNWVDITN